MSTAAKEEILKLSHLGEAVVELDEMALALKKELIDEAESIDKIENAFEAELAAEAIRRIKDLTTEVEDARKSIKAPVLKIGRQIDGVAKDFCESLEGQKKRVSRLLGNYQMLERKKQEKAREEAIRKEREERLRMEMKLEGAKSGEEYDKIQDEGIQKIAEAKNQLAETKANEPKGVQLRKVWKFEVTDINLLYEKNPTLVNLEPNGSAIRAVIKHNQNIPGLKIWEECNSVV